MYVFSRISAVLHKETKQATLSVGPCSRDARHDGCNLRRTATSFIRKELSRYRQIEASCCLPMPFVAVGTVPSQARQKCHPLQQRPRRRKAYNAVLYTGFYSGSTLLSRASRGVCAASQHVIACTCCHCATYHQLIAAVSLRKGCRIYYSN